MGLPTHSNANTETLCLNLEYPWSLQHKRSQIFSLFLLRSGRCGDGKRRGGSRTGRTAACSSCKCAASAQPRLHRWPPWPGNGSAWPTEGRRERGEVGPPGAAHEQVAWPCLEASELDTAGSGGGSAARIRLVLRFGFGFVALWTWGR